MALQKVRAFQRFLVIPDIHIGDAVLTQPALTGIRDFFPRAEIDYVVNRGAASLVAGSPDATRVLPLFSGGTHPTPDDVSQLRALIAGGNYDLCLSFTSLLEPEEQADPAQPVISVMSRSPTLVRNEGDPDAINHFSFQHYRFVRELLSNVASAVRPERYPGFQVTLPDQAIERALTYAAQAGLNDGRPVFVLNPDGASAYTRIPFDLQHALLRRIAREAPAGTAILVGAGHTADGIGQRLVDALPAWVRATTRVIPRQLPLAVFTALLDLADVFVTGDTGPLHLAAARRTSGSGSFRLRNRTAIISVFGATLPRMSGYDSARPGFLPANQDAPSWCVHAPSRCHNITCLNKLYKTCRSVRCFEKLDVDAVARVAVSWLRQTRACLPVVRGSPVLEQVPA
jgi:ADP-heptose:LPS heptosyltransferase